MCEQVRLKLACSAVGTSWRLEISDIETTDIILYEQRIIKVLIRLRGCAGWSAPLLFAYGINRFSHDVAHKTAFSDGTLYYRMIHIHISCVCHGELELSDRDKYLNKKTVNKYIRYLGQVLRKRVLWHTRTTKTQISMRICSWVGWFETNMVKMSWRHVLAWCGSFHGLHGLGVITEMP